MLSAEDVREQVIKILGTILSRKGINSRLDSGEASLYEDGAGLDSLDAAELSARLEQAFGRDPFSVGVFPRTLGELVNYFVEVKNDA